MKKAPQEEEKKNVPTPPALAIDAVYVIERDGLKKTWLNILCGIVNDRLEI